MSYPRYFATEDGLQTYKLVSSTVRTIISIVDTEDFYTEIGDVSGVITEAEIVNNLVEISEGEWESVLDDVDSVARIGGHPAIKPHLPS